MNTIPKVLVDVSDGIMTATLNRPAKLNATDNDLSRELLAAVSAAASNEAVCVLHLNGAGRAFCAGRDVDAPPTDDDLVLVQSVSRALVSLPKPVAAAVHGWTVGAGLEWMLNADLVVAAQGSRFKLSEAALGVFVTRGLTATLPASAGLARAKGLIVLGDEFGASQAQAWGLAWQVFEDAELRSASRRLSARLAALAPKVVARYKKVLNEIGLRPFEQAIEAENEAQRTIVNAFRAVGAMDRSERA